jgi:2'-5' RNA ligase
LDDFFASVGDRWPASREDYHWLVLPGTELMRDRISRQYSELTDRPGLVPVHPEFMHVSVAHLAPVDEITESELAQIVTEVRDGCAAVAPFAVMVGRAQAWEHGVVCPLRPGYLLTALRQVTTAAAKQVIGITYGKHPAVYHPYLTLAYATGRVDSDLIRAWLADCDATETAIPVTCLSLVTQQHDGREITFRVLAEVPLGRTGS